MYQLKNNKCNFKRIQYNGALNFFFFCLIRDISTGIEIKNLWRKEFNYRIIDQLSVLF